MKHHPDGGMYGIKKVGPGFMTFKAHWPTGENQSALMSFSEAVSPNAVAAIPVGHRALLYVTGMEHPKDLSFSDAFHKFIAEIEIVGTLKDGRDALQALSLMPGKALPGADPKFNLFRPIRYLVRLNLHQAKTWQQVCASASVSWTPKPQPHGHGYISQTDFQSLRNAM